MRTATADSLGINETQQHEVLNVADTATLALAQQLRNLTQELSQVAHSVQMLETNGASGGVWLKDDIREDSAVAIRLGNLREQAEHIRNDFGIFIEFRGTENKYVNDLEVVSKLLEKLANNLSHQTELATEAQKKLVLMRDTLAGVK